MGINDYQDTRAKFKASDHFRLVHVYIFTIFYFNILFIFSTCPEDYGQYSVCNFLFVFKVLYSCSIIFAVK